MPFDAKAFMAAGFVPRTAEVAVPGLAAWFGDDAAPMWIVRGQTASEVARANEAAGRNKTVDAIVKAIAANVDQVAELQKAIGLDTGTPEEIIKRLEQLTQCSVAPEITLDLAVKLAEVRPVEFYILTNEIVRLTGLGMDVKKPKASGATANSGG